ncbi:MAG: hypothetical protein AVDCRST_MAG37-3466, partial [uncultured Rubrobacteraceae bacterium]
EAVVEASGRGYRAPLVGESTAGARGGRSRGGVSGRSSLSGYGGRRLLHRGRPAHQRGFLPGRGGRRRRQSLQPRRTCSRTL